MRTGVTTADLAAAFEAEPSVRVAVLFGSASRGEAGPGSDMDIAVEGVASNALSPLAVRLSRRLRREVDLVAFETSPPLLRFEIARDGVLLVERVPHRWSDLKARALVDWWDWAPTLRAIHRRTAERLLERTTHGST